MNVFLDGDEIGGWNRTTGIEVDRRAFLASIQLNGSTLPQYWTRKGQPLTPDELAMCRAATGEDWEASITMIEAAKHLMAATTPFVEGFDSNGE